MISIAIFASGSGTNAENMMIHFKDSTIANISLIISNKRDAYVLKRGEKYGVPTAVISYKELYEPAPNNITSLLDLYKIDFIILAGFLLKVPEYLIDKYQNRIVNVHPALLPKYGGKGMYGENVHNAVIEAKENESGITIHLIDKFYDRGTILYQSKCLISHGDTPETLALKIHELEKEYPNIVEKYIKTLI
jgi:phosphoribosylglycinamide formyltransferase 1